MDTEQRQLGEYLPELPRDERECIERTLHEGEHILWAAHPQTPPLLWQIGVGGMVARVLFLAVGGILPASGLWIFFTKALKLGGVPMLVAAGWTLLTGLFWFVGWVLLNPWRERRQFMRRVYIITNERALVCEPGDIRAYALDGVHRDIRPAADGRGGSIVWEVEKREEVEDLPRGFLHVEDLREVLGVMARARQGQEKE